MESEIISIISITIKLIMILLMVLYLYLFPFINKKVDMNICLTLMVICLSFSIFDFLILGNMVSCVIWLFNTVIWYYNYYLITEKIPRNDTLIQVGDLKSKVKNWLIKVKNWLIKRDVKRLSSIYWKFVKKWLIKVTNWLIN